MPFTELLLIMLSFQVLFPARIYRNNLILSVIAIISRTMMIGIMSYEILWVFSSSRTLFQIIVFSVVAILMLIVTYITSIYYIPNNGDKLIGEN